MTRILALLFLVWSWPVVAQTGQVMSGRHPEFTRLTVPVAQDSRWLLGRTAEGYGLRIEGATDLDISRIYDRIGRDRLAAIDFDGETLRFSVACTCAATAFRFGTDLIVVDIRDGPPVEGSQFEVPLPNKAATVAQRRMLSDPAGPLRMRLPLFPGSVPIPVTGLVPTAARSALPATENVASVADPGLADLERQVALSLSRAASQGLLTLAPDVVAPDAPPPDDHLHAPDAADVAAPPEPTVDASPTAGPRPTPGLLAHTSLDAARGAIMPVRERTEKGALCWPDSFFAFADEGDAAVDFAEAIAAQRQRVSNERDRVDPQAVTDLARTYLSFGFGQEAIQVLLIDGVNDRERIALRAMAAVIDQLPQPTADLTAQAGCSGPGALWAVLASDDVATARGADFDRIVQHFKLLPEPLQSLVGPQLADLLRRAGMADAARTVLDPAWRTERPTVAAQLAQADLEIDDGNLSGATASLAAMVETDPRTTPEALVQLVDMQIAQNRPVAAETLALLEAMQFEYRSRPIVADILRARTQALIHGGALDAALALLPQAGAALPDAAGTALRDAVVAAIADKGSDMMFLDLAFRPDGMAPGTDTQNLVAARLLGLGFPDRALQVVATPATGTAMADRRYLRAAAMMDLGRDAEAISELTGISTPRADAILSGRGDTSADDMPPEDTAWRTGDWSTLAISQDPLLQDAAALVRDQVAAVPDTEAPLASGQVLIDDAARARATIDNLLSRFAPPG